MKPPYPGDWLRREDVPGGLDAARSLDDVCFWSDDRQAWETGITSEPAVRYFVRRPTANHTWAEKPWPVWELLVLKLMRQLPRENKVRNEAAQFLIDHGSGDANEQAMRSAPVCLGCHGRKGWYCEESGVWVTCVACGPDKAKGGKR